MYATDLAAIHEAGFADLAAAAGRMVCELASPGLVLDLGCGGGTLLAETARPGWRGWGVDISGAMVELARVRVPDASFAVGDAWTIPLPAGATAVTAVGEVANYALATHELDSVEAWLHRVRAALTPGGVLLMDIATTSKQQGERQVERSGRGWRVQAHVEVSGAHLRRTIDTWRTVRTVERHTREVHVQRLLDPEWLELRMQKAGFTVEHLGGYDDYGFQPGWDGFLARV